jgi:triacylglycerol lipase
MDTHVMMFNFAWYVYYYGTPKAKKVNPADAARFHVFAHVSEPATDTHALVVDTIDRIVVSFKGTTSMRNMQTSIQIYHERLAGVVPTNIDGVDETARLEDLFGRSYAQAKVHKGFAVAYRSVAPQVMTAVQQLLVRKRRPVFLTGHSLGGALATLCSLDVWIKLGLSRREISVSTFGSPRVGNDAFRHIYKSTVPLHWRIVVIPDVVTKHPKGGYKHVGKKVTLTRYGRMLIDPNVLEQLHWSSKSASFAYHRKASYMLAMRAWCVRNHGKSYVPEFWPFPVSGDDKKRFQSALEPADMDTVAAPRAMVPSRIIELDAMVDALGARDDDAQLDMSVVDLWGRLARRALLNETLAR